MQNNNRRQVPPYFAPPPPVQTTPEIIQQTKKSSTLTKELEVVDLNSYASRKSAIGGALGISLFSSNTDQLVTLINDTTWSTPQIVTLCLIVISLILQLFTFTIMAYLGGIGRVTNAKKKRMDRMNTTAMVLSMLTTLVNIAITSFSSKLNLNK